MGGTQGKVKGRGDGPEILYDGLAYLEKSGGRHNVGDSCPTSSIQMCSLQRNKKWNKLVIDSTISTPDFNHNHNQKSINSQIDATHHHHQHQPLGRIGITIKKPRTCRPQKVQQQQQQQRKRREQKIAICTKIKPGSETKRTAKEGEEVEEEGEKTILSSSFIVPPPKIRLQILSPVHSRHRDRMQEDSLIEIPCTSSSDLKPVTLCQEEDSKVLRTEEDKNLVSSSSSLADNTKNTSPSAAPSPAYSCPNKLVSAIYRSPRLTPECAQGGRCMNQMMMRSPPPPIPNSDKSLMSGKVVNKINTVPSPRIPHSLPTTTRSRETIISPMNETETKRKLKVKGLKNFIDSHRRPCPSLWAKQFPCRSKFHPDNYLYDFEGIGAPKRPTGMMNKCSKKCGRCNRCGVYVDSVCTKCNRCAQDCRCSAKTNNSVSNNNSVGGVPLAPPSLPSFAPTAEHFVSQLFGPNWSQTQKIKVNDVPIEPDRPKRNLHDCSSNNPLKIKNSSPVLGTGYDSYAPLPDPQQQAQPPPQFGYSPYPGGWYPSFPAPYPSMPYYPSYMPVPAPAPFYGYAQPPQPPTLPNPNYSSYQGTVTK